MQAKDVAEILVIAVEVEAGDASRRQRGLILRQEIGIAAVDGDRRGTGRADQVLLMRIGGGVGIAGLHIEFCVLADIIIEAPEDLCRGQRGQQIGIAAIGAVTACRNARGVCCRALVEGGQSAIGQELLTGKRPIGHQSAKG
jgi:hypothetical protein